MLLSVLLFLGVVVACLLGGGVHDLEDIVVWLLERLLYSFILKVSEKELELAESLVSKE